jgi:L-aminopeptidase/D-esterase-like protein
LPALRHDDHEAARGWARDLPVSFVPAGATTLARRGTMSAGGPLPAGFAVGHWTDREGATGCTVVLAPPDGAVAAADVRGGGPATRQTDPLHPLANAPVADAVLMTGGSAFGLGAADGVMRWLEERDRGFDTPGGVVPLVPAAVVYDLLTGDPRSRPGPDQGYAACEAADGEPPLGSVGAGTGAAVGKLFGRSRSVKSGVGMAKQHLADEARMTALAIVNAFGDVIGEDGQVLAGTRAEDGGFVRSTDLIRKRLIELPKYRRDGTVGNTTLVCLMTDASLTKTQCGIVAKMAQAGMARAVDPVHSAVDGDVVFCLASGTGEQVEPIVAGVIAAALTAEAIRDACHRAEGLAGIPALRDLYAP